MRHTQAVLNSDSEIVLLKGLSHFASQIRQEHGLLPPLPRAETAGPAASAGAIEIDGGGDGGEQEEMGLIFSCNVFASVVDYVVIVLVVVMTR